MSILQQALGTKAILQANELAKKAIRVRDYWLDRMDTYTETSQGLEELQMTYTELNERRAEAKADRMDELARKSVLLPHEAEEIEKACKRLPREWRTP